MRPGAQPPGDGQFAEVERVAGQDPLGAAQLTRTQYGRVWREVGRMRRPRPVRVSPTRWASAPSSPDRWRARGDPVHELWRVGTGGVAGVVRGQGRLQGHGERVTGGRCSVAPFLAAGGEAGAWTGSCLVRPTARPGGRALGVVGLGDEDHPRSGHIAGGDHTCNVVGHGEERVDGEPGRGAAVAVEQPVDELRTWRGVNEPALRPRLSDLAFGGHRGAHDDPATVDQSLRDPFGLPSANQPSRAAAPDRSPPLARLRPAMRGRAADDTDRVPPRRRTTATLAQAAVRESPCPTSPADAEGVFPTAGHKGGWPPQADRGSSK
jgi:hypothetical protein